MRSKKHIGAHAYSFLNPAGTGYVRAPVNVCLIVLADQVSVKLIYSPQSSISF